MTSTSNFNDYQKLFCSIDEITPEMKDGNLLETLLSVLRKEESMEILDEVCSTIAHIAKECMQVVSFTGILPVIVVLVVCLTLDLYGRPSENCCTKFKWNQAVGRQCSPSRS
jgi:hypothetical protein